MNFVRTNFFHFEPYLILVLSIDNFHCLRPFYFIYLLLNVPISSLFYNQLCGSGFTLIFLAHGVEQGSILRTFYAQLLCAQIPKEQKGSPVKQLFLLLGSGVNFINVFTRSFYTHRSQKRKTLLNLTLCLALLAFAPRFLSWYWGYILRWIRLDKLITLPVVFSSEHTIKVLLL